MNKKYKIKKWNGFLCFTIAALFIASCRRQPDSLEKALTLAGNNRPELEKVLKHYSQNAADSLKLKATVFLIENMPIHYYRENNPELFAKTDSLNLSGLSFDEISIRFDSIMREKRTTIPKGMKDLQSLSAAFLIAHIDKSFENWEESPWKDKISFKDFCEYVLPYAVSNEKRELWTDYYRSKYLPFISESIQKYNCDSLCLKDICILLNDSLKKISPIALRDEGLIDYPPIMADHIYFGICDNYTARTIYLMRSLGMPVGKDFAPQWGDYTKSHSWNTLLTEDGRHYPFLGFDESIDKWVLDFRIDCPKMFRITYGIQKESLAAKKTEEEIPHFLKYANLIDVTKEYIPVSNVSLPVDNPQRKKIAYLCVFDNKDWTPIHWGFVEKGTATFKDMGRNVVYLPAFYIQNRFVAANCPFILNSAGQVIPLQTGKEKETLLVERKFHSRKMQLFLPRMLHGRFLGANTPNFSDEKTIYQIPELPKLSFNIIDVNPGNEYRYVRYKADSTNYPDIAELEFYTKENEQYRKLTGKIIGTDGSVSTPIIYGKEVAFDGNWLTFFDYHSKDAWVGLDFEKKERIERICFLPRNDDNSIHPGDLYELFYWDNGTWNSLGKKTGDDTYVLVYDNCPSGALFLLHNHTRGKEERIFTYENGKQVFW